MDADEPSSFREAIVIAAQPEERGAVVGGPRGFRRCAALKQNGQRCANGAMAGMDVCGPHGPTQTISPARQCKGITKAGQPCRAGAVQGEDYCPQHAPTA